MRIAFIFNIFASIDARTVTVKQTIKILDLLAKQQPEITIYITYFQQKSAIIDEIIKTAIVHIASAFNKPVIALFEKGNQLLQTNWATTSDKYYIVEFFNNNEDIDTTVTLIVDPLGNLLKNNRALVLLFAYSRL